MAETLTRQEKAQRLMDAIRAYRAGAQTHEALVRLARELYADAGKTVRVYVRRRRQSSISMYGYDVLDGAGLRDVVINVGDDR